MSLQSFNLIGQQTTELLQVSVFSFFRVFVFRVLGLCFLSLNFLNTRQLLFSFWSIILVIIKTAKNGMAQQNVAPKNLRLLSTHPFLFSHVGITLTSNDPPPSRLGLLHQNVYPVPGLLHNVKYPVIEPINDNAHGDRLSNMKIVTTIFLALKLTLSA